MLRASTNLASLRAIAPCSHRRPLRAGLLACVVTAIALLILPVVHQPGLRLVWNASKSVPLGLYRVQHDPIPRVGDMVALRPSPVLSRFMAERHYVEANVLLIKPVAAAGGATVCRVGLRVMVDGRAVADVLTQDRFGRVLPRWSGCRMLAADQLFLIAPAHRDSFDSRYFGPVNTKQIIGRAVPLWTWS